MKSRASRRAFGMRECEREPRPAAHRLADQRRALDARVVEDRRQISSEAARVERAGRARRAAEAAVIEGDDAMLRREDGKLLPPRERAAAGSVHEHDRRLPVARRTVLFVVQRRAVSLDRRHGGPC
jgi:hypothetical protein